MNVRGNLTIFIALAWRESGNANREIGVPVIVAKLS
jgi:hypothetical protein